MSLQDFGEKISGAVKDRVYYRKKGGLTEADIKEWNKEERESMITKDLAFPKPNYEDLYSSGKYTALALYFRKRVRDSLPATPVFSEYLNDQISKNFDVNVDMAVKEVQLSYVRAIYEIKRILDDCKQDNDIYNAVDQLLSIKEKGYQFSLVLQKCKLLYELKHNYSIRRLEKELDEKPFLKDEETKLLMKYKIIKVENNNLRLLSGSRLNIRVNDEELICLRGVDKVYMDITNWYDETYLIVDNRGQIRINNLSDYETAKKKAYELCKEDKEKASKSSKKLYVPEQLKTICRTGIEVLDGKDADGELMMQTFGLRAGQFGTHEYQNDRQTNINLCYEAFYDLAVALDIANEDVSLGGRLAVSYGARGSGNAAAHYEPVKKVINLTKESGAGFLGHEWAHALDNHMAAVTHSGTTFLSSKSIKTESLFANVMDAIKYEPRSQDEYETRTATKFYTDSKKMDVLFVKNGLGYWASEQEMFARAFHSYLADKLSPMKSDYLCGQADVGKFDYNGKTIYSYPVGQERERINAAFDQLFNTLKEKGLLHDRSKTIDAEMYYNTQKQQIMGNFDFIMDSPDCCQQILNLFGQITDLLNERSVQANSSIQEMSSGIAFIDFYDDEKAIRDEKDMFSSALYHALEAIENSDSLSEMQKNQIFKDIERNTSMEEIQSDNMQIAAAQKIDIAEI